MNICKKNDLSLKDFQLKAVVMLGITTCILTLSFVFPGFAESEYYIGEMDLRLTVPDGFYTYTRDVEDSDPGVAEWGIQASKIREYLEADNAYMYCLSIDGESFITISMAENALTDLYNIDDSTILQVMPSVLETSIGEDNAQSAQYNIIDTPQAKFVEARYSQTVDEQYYYIDCMTIRENKAINVILQSSAGELTDGQIAIEMAIINSFVFGDGTPNPNYSVSNVQEDQHYVDEETNVEFDLPTGWEEKALTEERLTMDTKFCKDTETISYGSISVDALLEYYGYNSLSQEMVKSWLESGYYISDIIGTDDEDENVEMVTYNGYEYFRYINPSFGDNTLIAKWIIVCRYADGYIYIFQFMGLGTTSAEEEFYQLLETVVYLQEDTTGLANNDDPFEAFRDSTDFQYDDDTMSEWTYASERYNTTETGYNIDIIFAEWGNTTELTYIPEMRFFIDQNGEQVVAENVMVTLDDSKYYISLETAKVSNYEFATFYMTEAAEDFLKALAMSENATFNIFLPENDVLTVSYTKEELSAIDSMINDFFEVGLWNFFGEDWNETIAQCEQASPIQCISDSSQMR